MGISLLSPAETCLPAWASVLTPACQASWSPLSRRVWGGGRSWSQNLNPDEEAPREPRRGPSSSRRGGSLGGAPQAVTTRLSGHVLGLSGHSVKCWKVALGLASPPVICDRHACFLQAGLRAAPSGGGAPLPSRRTHLTVLLCSCSVPHERKGVPLQEAWPPPP